MGIRLGSEVNGFEPPELIDIQLDLVDIVRPREEAIRRSEDPVR
jgi:hypothetical protein